MNEVITSLVQSERSALNGTCNLVFRVTNNSSNPISILKRSTPLEGLRTNCLRVVAPDGRELSYDGLILVRHKPALSEFEFLAPGETISEEFNLSDCYSLTCSGKYEIRFNGSIFIKPAGESSNDKSMFALVPCSIEVVLDIEGYSERHLTYGERIRSQDQASKISYSAVDPDLLVGAIPPQFNGSFTEAQKDKLRDAHSQAYTKSANAASSIANNTQYKEWFGTYSSDRFNKVKGVFQAVKSVLAATTFTYDNSPLSSAGCGSQVLAWTTFENTKIYICSLFWTLPDAGISMPGTLLHEYTHIAKDTKDHTGVDISECKSLALSSPDRAIDNGASYQFFAGG